MPLKFFKNLFATKEVPAADSHTQSNMNTDKPSAEAESPKQTVSAAQITASVISTETADKPLLQMPYGTKISRISNEGIEFYWKPLEGVTGYEVFRSNTRTGKPKKIATVAKARRHVYCDSAFNREKKRQFYSVRSYKKLEDGTTAYSVLTKPKLAKFREELLLERETTYLYSGDSRKISAFYGWGELEDATWTSSNPLIASVSQDGIITAKSRGECMLTCTNTSNTESAQTLVVVDRKDPFSPASYETRYTYNKNLGCLEQKSVSQEANASDTPHEAVIMMVGDLMCGSAQMKKQGSAESGWDFTGTFRSIKRILAESDLAIANLETLLAPGWPYMLDEVYIDNMNNCNAVPQYLDALRYAGFDALVTANNHNCDGGPKALLETIETLKRYQYPFTGIFCDANTKRTMLANVNGIKIGIVSYISKEISFNGKDKSFTEEEKDTFLNIFSRERLINDIASCKRDGAEFVIVYMHWGFKNYFNTAKHQISQAKIVANAGANLIIGSNPHVLQQYDEITCKDGRVVPCYFSVGNFQAVMNQIPGNRESIIVRIKLKKETATGTVTLEENTYIPCYTYDECKGMLWAPIALYDNNPDVDNSMQLAQHRASIAQTLGDKAQLYSPLEQHLA